MVGAGAEVRMAGRAVAPEEGRAIGRDDMLGARPPTRPPERPASAASMGENVSARARKTDIAGFFQSVAAITTDGEATAAGLATMGVIGTNATGESSTIADIRIQGRWRSGREGGSKRTAVRVERLRLSHPLK